MIGISEIFKARGFEPDSNRVKLVRHTEAEVGAELLQSPWLDYYQKYQHNPIFDECDQIIVFVGEERSKSRFIGVYDVGERMTADEAPSLPAECPRPEWAQGGFYYPQVRRSGFEDLEGRLIIDWGKDPINWHKPFRDRPVIEIRPPGRTLPPFRDYLLVNLRFDELVRLRENSEAHRDWFHGLKAVGAIYLIVNSRTGQQYVGSATGESGLWQRWSEYAKTGHGNNLRLKEVCTQDAGCPAAFRFSILETFSRSKTRKEALLLEAFFKEKLGTRAFGLNAN
ncbi:MAG: GIY-YIG nuclease family protein [Candidatus Cybelea sp.]|jgi:hypothetical protein